MSVSQSISCCPSNISRRPQCSKEIQQLHMSLRKLKIGTYVAHQPGSELSDPKNPYYPIATASLSTSVFDIVHMFSERSISAVPIIDEEGVVVNLYETVDVIVSLPRIFVGYSLQLLLHRPWSDWEPINLLISQYRKPLTRGHRTSQVS